MAEVVSFISGILTIGEVTLRTGEAIFKLGRLWARVNDVPRNIIDLTQRLECLDPSLLEIESIFKPSQVEQTTYLGLALKRTTAYCRLALDDLNSLVSEMSHSIDSHTTKGKVTCFRILLEKDSLGKIENRLGSAVSMLSLVQQTYLIALTRAQPDIIIQRWSAHSSHNIDPQDAGISSENRTTYTTCNVQTSESISNTTRYTTYAITKSSHSSKITLRVPRWISSKVWEICCTRALGDWTFQLRSYSTRPSDSQVFQVARAGSPASLRNLFEIGLASPYDRTIDGETLFHEAVRGLNVGTARYLVTTCLNFLEADNYGLYPIAKTFDSPCSEKDAEEFINTIRSDRNFGNDFLLSNHDNTTYYSNTRRTSSGEISSTAFDFRVSRWFLRCLQSPRLLRAIIQPACAEDTSYVFERRAMAVALPIMLVVSTLGGAICPYPCRNCRSHSFDWEEWFASAKTAIKQTPDIHITQSICMCWLENKQFTALTRLLFHALNFTAHRRSAQWWECHFLGTLRVWLRTLKKEGVDLVCYGRRELEILREEDTYRDWEVAVSYPRRQTKPYLYYGASFRLISFDYGPSPEDWVVYLSEPTDLFAGEFWRMIDNPQRNIPGSWVGDN
ncbi:hypothetical protein F4803DRAFT_208952 [Xylaria telfairii]|nr:hypothetical protein F4803DRAFT_208952 [Xylaria telfairii]